jgi:hypothetical protein
MSVPERGSLQEPGSDRPIADDSQMVMTIPCVAITRALSFAADR